MAETFRYRAFISYSHRDRKWGDWLHKSLESYRVPKRLVGTQGRDGPVPARLYPIFRDREELPTSDDLSSQIQTALEQSAYLIVVCSPSSGQSRWVNEEILAYKRMGRENRILAIIVDGTPNASENSVTALADDSVTSADRVDPSQECFPLALKYRLGPDGQLSSERTEPIAADARDHADGKDNAKLKLISGLLGVGFDVLKQRDLEAQRKRTRFYRTIAAAMTVLAIGALGAGWLAIQNEREAVRQLNEALTQQSRFLASESARILQQGDAVTATEIALQGLPGRSIKRPLVVETSGAFQNAISADHLITELWSTGGHVLSAAYSPDGKSVVATSSSTALICDATTGALIKVLSGHGDTVTSATFSPNGQHIVTASWDKTARIWGKDSGKSLVVLSGHRDYVYSAIYSPDGKRIVTASADKTSRIWNAVTGKQLVVLTGHSDIVWYAAFSPDGRYIVTASADKTARIWDSVTGKQLAVLRPGHSVQSAVFSHDGRTIITTSSEATARIWDAASGKQLFVLSGHGDTVNSAAYSPDGKRIVTASDDHTARIWDAVTGKQLAVLSGHGDRVNYATYSPDGRYIVTASNDGTSRIWADTTRGVLTGNVEAVNSAVFSPNGRYIVTASYEIARTFDVVGGAQGVVLSGHSDDVKTAAYSPDGRHIVTASDDDTARIWDATTGVQLALLTDRGPLAKGWSSLFGYNSAAYSPDGKRIVTSSSNDDVIIWDANMGARLKVLSGHSDIVHSATYSPDGTRIVTASSDRTARIWDVATGRQLFVLSGHGDTVNSASWSPDGQHIVTASDDRTARIWDAATGIQIAILSGHVERVSSASFSPDGSHIVTASWDKTARIWDAASGAQLAVLSGHREIVNSASYAPDGKHVVTASQDQTARIWDISGIPSLDTQFVYAEAAEFDPLPPEIRKDLGLPDPSSERVWPANPALCDLLAASWNDPDRMSPGVALNAIDAERAFPACAEARADDKSRARFAYQRGRALERSGDFTAARRAYEDALARGYRMAAVNLAFLLSTPSDGMLDPSNAVRLYEQAWNHGVKVAAYDLGAMYENGLPNSDGNTGHSFVQDKTKAWDWYRKGADAGEPWALAEIADHNVEAARTEKNVDREKAELLEAFSYFAAACARAQAEGWPDAAWKQWRHGRAALARTLAAQAMMQQIADTFNAVRDKLGARQPTVVERIGSWVDL